MQEVVGVSDPVRHSSRPSPRDGTVPSRLTCFPALPRPSLLRPLVLSAAFAFDVYLDLDLPLCFYAGCATRTQPKKLPSADEHDQPAGLLGERFLRLLFPKQGEGETVMARASSVMDMGTGFGKPGNRGVWPRVLKR